MTGKKEKHDEGTEEDIFVEMDAKKDKKQTPPKKDEKQDIKVTQSPVKAETEKEPKQEKQLLLDYYSKEDLAAKIKELEKKLSEKDELLKKSQEESGSWKNKYTYLQAEFENAHKRWDKNKQDLKIEYTASVLKSFLPLYDSFKKAVETDKNKEILTQFFNQFLSIFKLYQAEPIKVKPNDLFDYNIHEALTSIEKEDVPTNSVVDVIQDGWKLGKSILRFAKVVISKKPAPPPPPLTPEPEQPTGEEEKKATEEKPKEPVSEDKEKEPSNDEYVS